LREISLALVRHGFGVIVSRAGNDMPMQPREVLDDLARGAKH